MNRPTLEQISSWAKRRGFVYPSSEIYGGMANTYDFGPHGTQLKENLRQLWWKRFIVDRDDIYGIDASVLLNPKVWEASGHTESFADVMVEDKVSHKRYRYDHLLEEKLEALNPGTRNKVQVLFFDKLGMVLVKKGNEISVTSKSPKTEEELKQDPDWSGRWDSFDFLDRSKVDGLTPEEMSKVEEAYIEITKRKFLSPDGNELTAPKRFNQLFQTEVGIISGEKNKTYLRGEIAQGLFLNFKNILDSMHPRLPFGIGQAGKAFRNEITMGKFTYRTLEFDLMEFEYFFDHENQKWEELYESWKKEMDDFAAEIGLNKDHLRWRAHEDFERSHYSTRTEDLEYEFPWGFKEMWGLAYRTDFDLKNHEKHSGKELRYVYPDGKKVLPHVIEPTFGLSRLMTVLFFDAYTEETLENGKTRTVFKINPKLAPVKAAVFPLQKDDNLRELAKSIYTDLKDRFAMEFDDTGNIGKMYRRQDEIGTPFCITVDYDSVEDKKVTVRERDSMKQERVAITDLAKIIKGKIDGKD